MDLLDQALAMASRTAGTTSCAHLPRAVSVGVPSRTGK